jgi:23S rRNA (uracil1939-C5)-methyltransferase
MSRGPMPPGPPEEGVVAALNHDGEGVLRGEKTVFVPGTLPGEQIRFRRLRRHRQHDEGEVLEVLSPSAGRVTPPCAHFGVCGGCALQHLDPAAQIDAKQQELAATLVRIGRVEPRRWLDPLRGPSLGYRRRARLGAKFVPKRGRVLVGFRERAKPYVAALDSCAVLAPPLDGLITPMSSLLTGLDCRRTIPQIEVAVGEDAVALVFRVLEAPGAADLAALYGFGEVQGIRIHLQPAGIDSVRWLRTPDAAWVNATAADEPWLHYSLPAEGRPHGVRIAFRPTDFVQVNATVNRLLVAQAIEQLQIGASDRVLDLFCGLGNFTLPMAARAREVVGIEGEAGLVERGRHNARLNGLDNAVFHAADLSTPDGGAAALAGGFSRVLLDPPRAGALEVLPRVAALGAERIVYVSCHPGTLARDLELLCHTHGYRLEAAGVIDMFPHTTHVESMAVLERTR